MAGSITQSRWRCRHCGRPRSDEDGGLPCPDCGKVGRKMDVEIQENVQVLASTCLEKREPKIPGRRPGRAYVIDRWEYSRDLGELVHVSRHIDRDNDTYDEVIRRADGSIIREIHEPLSNHRGRGSKLTTTAHA